MNSRIHLVRIRKNCSQVGGDRRCNSARAFEGRRRTSSHNEKLAEQIRLGRWAWRSAVVKKFRQITAVAKVLGRSLGALGLLALLFIVVVEDQKTPGERSSLKERYSRKAHCAPRCAGVHTARRSVMKRCIFLHGRAQRLPS
jgi:hypothetical protein